MKKFLSFILSILMLATTQITAFAAGNFVGSPTANNKPTLIEATSVDGNTDYEVVLNAYSERNILKANQKADMENAYNSIVNANQVLDLNSGLKTVAENKNVAVENLAVSDLFYVSYREKTSTIVNAQILIPMAVGSGVNSNNSNATMNHGTFNIKLKAATLNNFVALMHYDGANWTTVENAKVDTKAQTLSFTTDKEGAFAVVVDSTGANVQSPATGSIETYVVAVIGVLACAVLVISKFNSNNKERA